MGGLKVNTIMRWKAPLFMAATVAALVLLAGIIPWAISGPTAAPAPGETHVGTIAEVLPPRAVPELHFTDGSDHQLTLTEFKGRAVLLNLWATWCMPCRKEMPSLDRLAAKLGGPDFMVVPLSIDRKGTAVVLPFYRELELTSLGIYVDLSGKAPLALEASGIPMTLLIDREGREVARLSGAAEWDSPAMIQAVRRYLHLPNVAQGQQAAKGANQ
ncbi:MAG TPA: TlpA disulfide reductase family protein [Acetobacteraceae bacterium]|nr:TlpA disulfide reductase family protein [Acetobacteraceae bacterium]